MHSKFQHWNDTLAKRAQERADKCVYAHGSISGAGTPWANVGENLYVSSVSYSLPWAVDNWALGEMFYYDYDTATCQPGQMCGHYTQVQIEEISSIWRIFRHWLHQKLSKSGDENSWKW